MKCSNKFPINHKDNCQCGVCKTIRGETSGKNWSRYGKNFTSIDTRLKISKANKGKKLSEEQKREISKRMLGKKRPHPKTCKCPYCNPIKNKIFYCTEIGCKNEVKRKGQFCKIHLKGHLESCICPKCKPNLYIHYLKNRKPPTEETKRKISCANKGRKLSEEMKKKLSNAKKKNWQNVEYRNKQLKAILEGSTFLPNKFEKKIENILITLFGMKYSYVGNGKIFIDQYNPDFINFENGKIIEAFGCYWHKCRDCGYIDTNVDIANKVRVEAYKKKGYASLIIWEHELQDLELLKNKLINFDTKDYVMF